MKKYLSAGSVVLGLLLSPATLVAGDYSGIVRDVNGHPVAGVLVTLDKSGKAGGASAVTVYTGDDGDYLFTDEEVGKFSEATISVKGLNYRQVFPAEASIKVKASGSTASSVIHFTVKYITDQTAFAPASAWLAHIPETSDKHLTQALCVGCHQFPTPKVRNYAEAVAAISQEEGGSPEEKEAWKKQVHKEAWRAAVKYMRARSYDIFPENSDIRMENVPWNIIQAKEYSIFNEKDEETISEFLATYMPDQFKYLEGYSYGAPLAVTPATSIREYKLPDTSLVREATMVRGSKYIWGADIHQNRLLRLDPDSGEKKWFNVPYARPTGPHTILGDSEGNVWVSMIESDLIAMFAPDTEKWSLWSLRLPGTESMEILGGQAMVHDVAYDENYELARDKEGRVWMSLIGSNKMASLDLKTGEVHHYDAAKVEGRTGVNVSLYGTLLSSDGKCAWYSQLAGYVGCFNTETNQNEQLLDFGIGSTPRRMAIDKEDMLWIPLYGSGQLVKYDARQRRQLAIYDLPDRSSAPYALTWDAKRKAVWIATANADAIYRFDPETEKFSVIPLPRNKGFLRKIAIDPATNRLIATYGHIPAGSGPSMVLVITVGDEDRL